MLRGSPPLENDAPQANEIVPARAREIDIGIAERPMADEDAAHQHTHEQSIVNERDAVAAVGAACPSRMMRTVCD